MINVSKEIIWHFTCELCKGWWSIASVEHGWEPKQLTCPYCGERNETRRHDNIGAEDTAR